MESSSILLGPGAQGVRVQLESLESPELYAARARAVETDPRIRSLSNHMLKLNSIDPEDDDFSDLLPLRELLKGVRIVLLGEAEHGDGADFLAKTRASGIKWFWHTAHGLVI